jgi:hypothetical protein
LVKFARRFPRRRPLRDETPTASAPAVAILEVFEGHIFLSPREMASQVISQHLSQATVALSMRTNRLLAHDVLLLQHREQTASSIVEERNE